MSGQPSVLALRPGAKLSKADRETLRQVGIIVVQCAPEDLVAIRSVSILPSNEMLRHALTIINTTILTGSASDNTQKLRAELGKRIIESFLAVGEAK